MYIWLDFISKTGHVTYYYIPTNFSQKLSPKKGTKISYVDILQTPPPPPHVDKHEQFSNPPSPQTCYIVYGCPLRVSLLYILFIAI